MELFQGYFLSALLGLLCFVPLLILALVCVLAQLPAPSNGLTAAWVGLSVLCFGAEVFVSTNLLFTLPLIVDRRLGFWTAMKTSWRQVRRHWWTVFGLALLCGVIAAAGGAAEGHPAPPARRWGSGVRA